MPRPLKDSDATKKLAPDDKVQETPKGTKIGLRRRSEVLADFKKIIRSGKS